MTERASAIGAVLAGGRSRRMGRPKALVELAGRPLISYPLAAVEAAKLEPVVVAKPDSPLPPLGCRVVREPVEPAHPLRGILSALDGSGGRAVIVLGCDMPLVAPSLLAWLAGLDAPAAIPCVGGRLEPLLARYEPAVAGPLAAALERRAPLQEAVSALDPSLLAEPELTRFGDPELTCLNVNTRRDLERAASVIGKGG